VVNIGPPRGGCPPEGQPPVYVPPARVDATAWFEDSGGGPKPTDCWRAPPFTPKGDGGGPPGDKRGKTVVISDVHIGNNTKTCWYQRALHEPYLAAVLDYVIAQASDPDDPVTELVVLGDLFDFWTYPPEQQPPTVEEIIKNNQQILGRKGKLVQAVEAVHGNAIYLHGNHDIGITQADLDHLKSGDHGLTLVEDVVVDQSGLVLTHGHLFTLFNAPDERYPGEVPVGHFVTRAIAHYLENTLTPDQTAASLQDQGSPYGFNLASFIPALWADLASPSVTNTLLDYMADRCGLSPTAPIVLADGSTTTIVEVKKKYDGLWDDWVTRFGGGEIGETFAAKAAQADYDGSYMAWFAQKAAFDHSAPGTVTGHTHHPKEGIHNSTCLYLNCGFECPAHPDIDNGRALFTFGVINANGVPELWCVVKDSQGYCVMRVPSPPSDQLVYDPFMDYSCYVTIKNDTREELERVDETVGNGYYVSHPPAKIAPGATGRLWLQDLAGLSGSEGGTTYATADGGTKLPFLYGCPMGIFSNYASGGSSFVASSGSPPAALSPTNAVPGYGHPLFVDFTVGDETVKGPGDCTPGAWTPQSVLAFAVDAAGFRYDPRQDIIYSKMYPLQRHFGYAYGYDAAALAMNAIIDCEPIFFDYGGKTWMIELWKGQYGLETGCEIGVYNRASGAPFPYSILDATIGQRPGDTNPSHNLFFDCASDSELLMMSSTLYRNGKKLLCRGPERHWWLTGFKWGVLSEPSDLTMDVSITCLDAVMTSAFTGALTAMGYQNVQTNGNTVTFTFDTPKTHQPRDDTPQLVSVVRAAEQDIVTAYDSLGLASNDPNTVGDQAASAIGRSFAIYGEQFFAEAIANLARLFGIDLQSAVRTLTDAFQFALDAASQFVTNAGYTLASWINGLENIVSQALDFSCVIEIDNRGPYDLVRDAYGITKGNWSVAPPERIQAGGVGRFWLRDPKPTLDGSEGWANYSWVDSSGRRQVSAFAFADPTTSANVALSTSTEFGFYTKSGDVNGPWATRNSVVTGGHPFYVAFVWGPGPAP
jgi:UDP-2,3-diacylglucosamine pyrophosphatase LpxH